MTLENFDSHELFNMNPLPSWIYDLKTFEILTVNIAAIELYGYKKHEFTRLLLSDLHHPQEKKKPSVSKDGLKKEHSAIYFGVFSHQKKSGELILIEKKGHEVLFEGKKCMLIVALDVTEKETQIRLLEESEKKLNAISNIAKIGYWKLDLDGDTLTWSDEVYAIWGKKREQFDLNYTNFIATIHPDDLANFEEKQELAFKGLMPHNLIHRIILDNNQIRWVHEVGRLLKDKDGIPIAFEGTVQDITEQKKEEQHLKLLESVVTNTTDAVLITEAEPFDEPGPKIIYVNEAFTKMTGYTAAEVIGKTPRILQGPKTNKKKIRKLGKALRNWQKCETSVINYKKNGEEFWIHFKVSPVANNEGWYTHWIAIERDITEQKNQEFEKELLRKISSCFSQEDALFDASKRLCEEVGNYGDFDLVELWTPNLEKSHIQLINNYAVDKKFYSGIDSVNSFDKSIGMPGNVWKKSKQILWNNKQMNNLFIRKDCAKKAGINAVLGVPLVFKNEIVGVMLIGTSKKAMYLDKYRKTLQQLEKFIGSEIHRKKLENDLYQTYNTIPDILCVIGFNGHFLRINDAGCNLLGYSQNEILYQPINSFVHLEDQKLLNKHLKNLENETSNYQFETRFITKNKDIIWLIFNCNSTTKDKLIFAAAKDVSEKKKLKELSDQAQRLAKMGAWEIDLENSKLFWSEMVHELHETDPKTFTPNLETGISLYREDFHQLVKDKLEHAIATGEGYDFEAVKITRNFHERWFRSIAKVERLNGVSKRIYGSFQDIHEKKEIELRLQSFADNLPGVAFQYIVYPDGKNALKFVTKGAEKIWGYSAEEVMNDSNLVWDQIKLGGDFESVKNSIDKSIKNNTNWVARWRHIMPNGEIRINAGFGGSPVFLTNGTTLFNSLILDVTQEVKNEELLKQTSTMAKVGSWEFDFFNSDSPKMFWSPMIRNILEVDDTFNFSIADGKKFIAKQSIDWVVKSVEELIANGTEFDEQFIIIAASGKEKWVRAIGKSERLHGKCVKIYGSFQDIHLQKINEIELQKSLKTLEDYKFALDQSASITIADANGIITSVNEQFCKLSQYTAEELIGSTHKLINSKYHSKAFFASLWKTITKGKVWRGEVKNKAKDGSYYWADSTVVPFLDKNNKPFQYVAIRIDITAKKIATEKAIEILEEKNNILESINDGFYAVDKDWIITYWNKQAEKLNNLKREYVVGKNFWDVFEDAIDTDFYKNNQKAMKTGIPTTYQAFYERNKTWYEVSVYPSNNGLSAYFKDITQKKKSQIELEDAYERFEKVTEATNDAIYDWNITNDLHYWGVGFETIFGYDLKKMIPSSKLWLDFVHPEDVHQVKESLFRAIKNSKVTYWEEEYRYRKQDNSYAFVIDKGVFMRDTNKNAVRMVGAITDLTKQKNQELELIKLNEELKNYTIELERSNKDLEQFAFISSHDLQEPLRMITSFLGQLKRKYEDELDDKALLYINYATGGAERMKQIILDLLEYSRANKPVDDLDEVNLNDILDSYKELRRQLIQENSVRIIADKLPTLQTYRAIFTQILHCLIDNAIKYTRPEVHPVIEISATEKETAWLFAVKDNGIGIDKQFFEKIFVIFQRLHNKNEYIGTGIGLAITKRSVEFLGGTIWLTSEIGKGSTFYFTVKKNL